MWYGFRSGSGGARAGKGDSGAAGILPWGIGGGGTRGVMDEVPSGGDINAVLMDICGGICGYKREGMDDFLGIGALIGPAEPGGK